MERKITLDLKDVIIKGLCISFFLLLAVTIRKSLSDKVYAFGSDDENGSITITGIDSSDILEREEEWNLILVNKSNYVPDDFTVNLLKLANGHAVDERIYEDLQRMMDDARSEGLRPIIRSSYRSYSTQTVLYNNKTQYYKNLGYKDEEARYRASFWVAIPGTSEHQTGLAVDIVSSSYQVLDEKQENTKEQQWLMANCHKYGFILRYPKGKTDITGISYEPWHYRYVGVSAATAIAEKGICFEEYINLQNKEADDLI